MSKKKTPSARFAIVFMLTLAAISGGVFVAFSSYQSFMAMRRHDLSGRNLGHIGRSLDEYAAKNGGKFPDRASRLMPEFIQDTSVLIHPAWPEQLGYIYIPGVRTDDDDPRTILVYENVPERKRKLGILVLFPSGTIEMLREADFLARLKAQEEVWVKTGRVWMPDPMTPRDLK